MGIKRKILLICGNDSSDEHNPTCAQLSNCGDEEEKAAAAARHCSNRQKSLWCADKSHSAGRHAWRFGSFSATLQSSLHECPQLQMQKTGFLAWLQDMLLGLWWFQELLLPLIFLYDFLCAAGSVCFLPLCIAHSSSEIVSIYLHILCPGKGIPKEPSQPLATFFSFADSCHRYYSLQNGLQP